jgi:tRNA (guanine-N7-)-methyltransferase
VPWTAVFGNDRPVEIEIGPGRGDVLVAFARARPAVNFLAIEHVHGAAERLRARLDGLGVGNARVLAADAPCVIRELVPPASVAAYHAYFPDPWPKRRHRKRRLFTPAFARDLARTLAPGGAVHVATDLGWLFEEMARALEGAGFDAVAGRAAPERPTTRFERKYAGAGTFAASFVPGTAYAAAGGEPSPSPQKNS